jgi:hypothetical protein
MNFSNVWHTLGHTWRLLCFKAWPTFFVRCINPSLLPVSAWRALNFFGALLVGWMGVAAAWHAGVDELGWHSHLVQLVQSVEDVKLLRAHVLARQSKELGQEARRVQDRESELALLSQIDAFTLPWPNSSLRWILLSQLQKMASQKGLHLLQLKMIKLKDVQGYESSSLQFNVRGTAWATETFWRWVDQKLPNGQWLHLAWRQMPEGQYALEAHIQMLWDAQDAMTDTGVEMAWRQAAEAAALVDAEPSHVLPHQSQTSMRMVGSAQTTRPSGEALFWAFVRSEAKVHVVQSGQSLGIENGKVQFANGEGLWLQDRESQTSMPIAWDRGKP